MKRNNLLTIGIGLLLGVMALPMAAQVVNDDNEDGVVKLNANQSKYECVPGQVLVKFKDADRVQVNASRGMFRSTSVDRVTQVFNQYGVQDMEQLLPMSKVTGRPRRAKAYNGETIVERDLTQLYKVTVSADKVHETMRLVENLNELDEVEFAEPNYKMFIMVDDHIADSYSSNPSVGEQWYLDAYGVKELWNKPILNAARPVIAILDTGVDTTHPDLVDNIWTNMAEAEGEKGYDNDGNGFAGDVHGWDFVNNSPNVRDNNMHGTHVAGIAAAANNGIGIVGANPLAYIMPVTVMQSDGTGDVATIIQGINYAVANGATVINMSLGSYTNSHALRQALENAYYSAVIVASAGNDSKPISKECGKLPCPAPCFPAAYSFVLGVMATTEGGYCAGFTNFDCDGPNYSPSATLNDPDGFNYELKAPGTNILSTIPGGKYKALQGTSMSAPLVAGAISALRMVKQYDTQEMLWGDLTHTDDIAEACNLSSQPADLELVKVQYKDRKELADETEEDYNGDGEIDAGETVNIYPVLRTTHGPANNIHIHLEVGDNEDPDVVQILSETVDFGVNLTSYAKGVSLNPLQVRVPSGIVDGRHVRLKLVATCDDLNEAYEKDFVFVVNNMVKISGIIDTDRTLTADHVYHVTDNIAIPEGVTLTIEPGTRLEFDEGTGLASYGKLKAKGIPGKPIVFTGYNGARWIDITTHEPSGEKVTHNWLYTNSDSTLFTVLPTEQTPNRFDSFTKYIYLDDMTTNPGNQYLNLGNYTDEFENVAYVDISGKDDFLKDPNWLTPSVLQMLNDYRTYCNLDKNEGEDYFYVYFGIPTWCVYANPIDTLSYCIIEDFFGRSGWKRQPYMDNCIISPAEQPSYTVMERLCANRSNFSIKSQSPLYCGGHSFRNSNIVNSDLGEISIFESGNYNNFSIRHLLTCNFFNNLMKWTGGGKYQGEKYMFGSASSTPIVEKTLRPSYFGSGREDQIRPLIFEIGNAPYTYGAVDLSNMLTRPVADAHGIVWKVCVNGKDAQDEYEDLAPLGVGKHKFEVYFNRSMNKAVAPEISFGVRDPFTQNVVEEEGEDFGWNEEGTIYTAYCTVTGKTNSDGTNRIYVRGAEDDEFFEIPYEKTRFNVILDAAGSMATGFAAEAGMGKVRLTWNNENNDFDDAMGFNVYRYGEEYEKFLPAGWYDDGYHEERIIMVADTVRLNQEILDITTTEYTDYDVTPGETYGYYYKVLSTDLQEYDVSNVVAATPLTSVTGDADGSGDVKVGDVISTVNYILGENPKPFIFEAADVNTDQNVDVLDVIGIIQLILNQPSGSRFSIESMAQAVYTVEDGMLYIETPVTLAGVQAQLSLNENGKMSNENLAAAADMKGFEIASTWLTENDYRLLAYSFGSKVLMPGKHAIMTIGNADITSLRLSDTQGNSVLAVPGDATAIKDAMGSKVINSKGVWNLSGQKIVNSKSSNGTLPKGVYIINGEKVIK